MLKVMIYGANGTMGQVLRKQISLTSDMETAVGIDRYVDKEDNPFPVYDNPYKYKGKTDQQSTMAKSQETMILYKKYGINPISGCMFAIIQIPLFFAFLEAINRVPAIFEGTLFNMNLGMTPIVGLRQGNYIYLALIAIIIISTYFSFKISI